MTSNASKWPDRIRTNYVPELHEVDQLNGLLDNEMAEVHNIDEEIKYLRQCLSNLDARRSLRMKNIQEYRALLAPARALPVEILGKIFLASLEAYLQDSPSSRMGKHPGKALSQVCRLWREIAIGMTALWSVIDVWLPVHPTRTLRKRYGMALATLPSEEEVLWMSQIADWRERVNSIGDMLESYLARSGNAPLTIAFSAKEAYPYPIDNERPLVNRVVSTIRLNYPRLENITFKFKIEGDTSPFDCLLVANPQDIPLLRAARLCVKPRDEPASGGTGDQRLRFQGPHLTSLTLDMRWYFVQWVKQGFDWANIVDLSLCTIGREDIVPPDVFSAMEVLRKCPKLVRCALELRHDCFESLPDHERTELYPITLPHLRSLVIRGHGVHLFMSRALSLPLLEDLSILNVERNPYNGEDVEITDGIVPWAQRYGHQLKSVAFEYGCLSQPQLLRTFYNLRAVVSLKLDGVVDYAKAAPDEYVDDDARARWSHPARLSNEVLGNLTPAFRDPQRRGVGECCCPSLARIECTAGDLDFNELGLVGFVAARRMADRVGDAGIGLLKESGEA
ncbi:hypothetical protein FA13DRAFT_1088375 [Coprinellus micaceus]|uniref:F-box domain-containing protein n=1 Tax=Coprinellus micaceus TaxID=71717 RepID=A0A4Y7TTG8_COPMI|nr:hypothetical protein FA13DRAFT_1088375 [Coprinellus micaceus]